LAEKHLHIVSFDVPFPADYGGVIDVFYKMKALHAAGVKVHLHCFAYGRESKEELKEYCEEVFYYPRNMNRSLLIHPLPFIVVSRQHDALLKHLKNDEYPILFEGLHCAYYLDHPELKGRDRFLRSHNIEHHYYRALASQEPSWIKKRYLKREAKKLERFEVLLKQATALFAISPSDVEHLKKWNKRVNWIPPFHANDELALNGKKEPYALYHGNLSVMENERAAQFLIDEVCIDPSMPLKIFGNGVSKKLKKKINEKAHISLIEGDGALLLELLKKAQVNILPTFQSTGMKLKLLFSLYNGGHCLVNKPMVEGTGLESTCKVAADAESMRLALGELWTEAFTDNAFEQRKKLLQESFSNQSHAQELIEKIFGS